MEYGPIHYPIEPSYREETESLMSPIVIQTVFDDYCMERLLEMETELMDFGSMNQDTIVDLESCDISKLGHEMIHESLENLHEENSPSKGNQEQLIMVESSLTDLLLMGAQAVEAQNRALCSAIIGKLKDLLFDGENIADSSFNQLALFFTRGLNYKSINAPNNLQEPISRQPDTFSAFQILQLSPCVKFAHFTANQAILEATQGDQEIHIIDFDILEGIQWPPLMVDLAVRKDILLKVTAIISDKQNADTVKQTGRRLKEYADSINLSFEFKQMVMSSEDDFDRIEMGHSLVVNCIIHQLHLPNRSFSLIMTFLSGMTRLSPKIIVLVEEELLNFSKIPSMSFVDFFCEALHHYNAISDSIMSSFVGGNSMELKLIENEFLGIRILDSLSHFPREKKERILWGDKFASLLKGFKPVPLSSCNVSQANFLVSLFSGGYWVQHEKCRLALCWKSRTLTTATIWVPNIKNQVR